MSIVTFDRDQADWGSVKIYPDGILTPFKPDKAVIHWGGYTNPGNSEANEAAVLRAIQKMHMAKKPHPWFDIGYGIGVGNTGLVYRLRGLNRQAATRGDIDKDGIPANQEAWAFLWIGGSGYVPSPAALASMGRIIRECQAAIPNFTVEPHSNFTATACPGDLWRQWIAEEGWTKGDDDMTNGFLRIFNLWTAEDLDKMKAAGYWKGNTSYYYSPTVTDEAKINLTIHILANGNKDIPTR